ncbi:MAG: hypothetical protein ABIL46_00435 [candidate division WOR-3 bacterium]
MKKKHLLIILLFIACTDYYGHFVPLGDEFEDCWKKINFEDLIYHIEASKINRNEFFIGSQYNIYILQDSIIKRLPITYPYRASTVIASSFNTPQRLLIGTDNREVYYCSMDGVIKIISFPDIEQIEHLSFSPLDTSIFYLAGNSILLKSDIAGVDIDTILSSSEKIINLSVKESGELFVATTHFLFCSIDQGLRWDTLYTLETDLISGFAMDKKQRLYLLIQKRILMSQDWTNWIELYHGNYSAATIAGIEDGLLLFYSDGLNVNAFKLYADGKVYDISMGIVHNFASISELPVIAVVNDKRFLISFSDDLEKESTLLSFSDTPLPP